MYRYQFAAALLFVVSGCLGTEYSGPAAPATAGDAPNRVSTGPASDADSDSTSADSTTEATDDSVETFVIDVRTQEEWDGGHIESAVHIPHGEIGDRIGEVTANKEAKIILYCKAGGRAGRAKEALEQLGFTNVENAGGYEDIKDKPLF